MSKVFLDTNVFVYSIDSRLGFTQLADSIAPRQGIEIARQKECYFVNELLFIYLWASLFFHRYTSILTYA